MNIDSKVLVEQGFVSVPYPQELQGIVQNCMGSWKKFCALPDAVKQTLPYSNQADGVGYECKKGEGPQGDFKENFDVTLAGITWLQNNSAGVQDPEALKFFQGLTSLIDCMEPVIVDFARSVEQEFDINGLRDEVLASKGKFFVRFIHYFDDKIVGQETASAHVDQSGFTLHLFESDAGLQCLSFNHKWIDMPVSSHETVIIPSMQLQLRSQGKLKALCHRVVATEKTAQTGRYSAVCFIQLGNTPKYNKKVFGRLQEKTPGFNYAMEHSQFKKFFE